MPIRSSSARMPRAATVLAAAGLLSLTGLTAGSAVAEEAQVAIPGPVSKDVKFSCQFPIVGKRDVQTTVNATFPDSVKVNQPIQVKDFNVSVKVDAATTDALRLVGAASVQGTATPSVDLDINGTPLGVTLPGLDMPSTKVPASGALNMKIVGEVPAITVGSAGKVSFAIGSKFTGTVTPKKADGSNTELGTFNLPCTMPQGQDAALATVPVQ